MYSWFFLVCISHIIVFVTHKEEFIEELKSKLKSKRNCDYFVFGFVNFENKNENSKSVLLFANDYIGVANSKVQRIL